MFGPAIILTSLAIIVVFTYIYLIEATNSIDESERLKYLEEKEKLNEKMSASRRRHHKNR